ncbi:MAG: hypothetical protein V7696_19255 [Halioglobus sp.]
MSRWFRATWESNCGAMGAAMDDLSCDPLPEFLIDGWPREEALDSSSAENKWADLKAFCARL